MGADAAVAASETQTEMKRAYGHDDEEGDSGCTAYLQIPREYIPALVGPKGQTVRELEQMTGTKINIPKQDSEFSG